MPSFWSDQYHHKLQSFGMPGIADRVELVDGDLDGPCIVEYHDDIGPRRRRRASTGPQDLAPYRKQLMSRA